MCEKNQLELILAEMVKYSEIIFKEKLETIILFGSYARGDYDDESDIDIMILADIKPEEVNYYSDSLIDCIYETALENDCVISPCVIPLSVFEQYKNVLPFYKNILKEGIRIGA